MRTSLSPQIAALQQLRGNPLIVYASMINDDGVRILYECLRKQGRQDHLDLVLSTMGGQVTATRQIGLLLRDYAKHLTILVPYRARSAGTLLCLCADELVLGPLAELGPIDSHLSVMSPVPDAPGMISARDIYTFRQMAEDWFGVTREEDRIQVLALLAQRIFPTTLSSFYRSDEQIRHIAKDLLKYQLPDAEQVERDRIVDQLVGSWYTHDYAISRSEARDLGLQVHFAAPEEEEPLWKLLLACREQISEHPGQSENEMLGLIASESFFACQMQRWRDAPSWHHSNGHPSGLLPEKVNDVRWEIDA